MRAMLIEFSVANYASFRARQTLSMAAAPQLRKKENLFEVKLGKDKLPKLLKAVAIYGPNASGKSNLLQALEDLGKIVGNKPTTQEAPLKVSSFRFDRSLADQPSEFEVHFIKSGCRYSYELHATRERICLERLIHYPNGIEKLLYHRERMALGEHYKYGDSLEGGSDLHAVWSKLTGPKTTFISQAVANSNEELTQLSKPFSWLTKACIFVSGDMTPIADHAQDLLRKNSNFRESLAQLLGDVDIPISKIRIDKASEHSKEFLENFSITQDRKESLVTILTHKTALGEADFNFWEESKGTQNLMGFWLPWTVFRIGAEDDDIGQILVVDELDASLHPSIAAELVRRTIDADSGACQLIFTTHNTNLMDRKILRRDQFWLTERDENGATQLRSVYDFRGRGDEDIEKRYFEGRYRSLPHVVSE